MSYENFQCTRCQGLAPTTDKRDLFSVVIGSNSIDVLHSCCYVGDMITSGGVCTEATIICGRTAWRNVLNSMFYALHANEWWALSKDDLLKLERNECAMMHWILTFFHWYSQHHRAVWKVGNTLPCIILKNKPTHLVSTFATHWSVNQQNSKI